MGYYIAGNTKELGIEKSCIVRIYNRSNGILLDEITSNETTGDYVSNDLGSEDLCYVVCHNNDNNYNSLILDRIDLLSI